MNNRTHSFATLLIGVTLLLAGLTGCSRRDPAKHLEIADRAFEQRDFAKAQIEYLNVIRLQRTNAHAGLRLTKILIAQGQVSEASKYVGWCRATFPQDVEIRSFIVEALAAMPGETNRARLQTELNELLQLDPANERGLLVLAASARNPEEINAANAKITELKSKAGERPQHKIAEAELLRRKGDTNGCESLLKAAIDLDPTQPTPQAAYAAFLMSQRRVEEGEARLRKAAELAPPYAPVRESWARYLLNKRRTDEARAVLDEIIAKSPERISAWALRAEIALADKKPEDAERFLGRALGQAPADSEALRVLAQLRVNQGKNDAAVRELEKITQLHPNSALNQYQLALGHLLNKDASKAAQALEQSVQLNPNAPTPTLLLADLSINQREFDRAAKLLRDFISRSPNVDQAYLLLMRAEQGGNRLQDAVNVANIAFQKFPTNPAVAFQRGILLRQLRNSAEARKSFEAAAALTTNNLPAIQQLMELDLETRDFNTALGRLKTRLDAFPNDASAWLLRSRLALGLRDQTNAEAAARKALEFAPDRAAPHLALAQAHLAANRKADAITELDQALNLETNHLETLRLRGEIASGDGDHEKARQLYETGLKVAPNDSFLLNNLAYLYSEILGKVEESRQYAVRAHEAAPQDPRIADTLGWIEYRRGQFPEALRLLTEAATAPETKDAPEVQFHLGMTHYMMGNEAAARAALQIAAGSQTDYPGRTTAREHLAMLRAESGKIDPETVRALEKRTKEAPNDLLAITRLASAYEATGANDKARAAYESALKLNAQSPAILAAYASFTDSKLNDPAKALELAKRARTIAPSEPVTAITLGRLSLKNADTPLAYSLLQEASRKSPDRPDVAFDFARAAFAQGKADEAVTVAQQVTKASDPALTNAAGLFLEMITLSRTSPLAPQAAQRAQAVLASDPTHGPALFLAGLAAEAQSQFPEARKAYEGLLARYPNCLPAVRQLAILCADRLGDDAKARELGIRAREANPRDDVLAAALGKAVCRAGDFTLASQLLTQAAKSRAQDASLFYHLGLAQSGLKRTNDAVASLEKSIAIDGKSPLAEEARKRLQELKKPAATPAK